MNEMKVANLVDSYWKSLGNTAADNCVHIDGGHEDWDWDRWHRHFEEINDQERLLSIFKALSDPYFTGLANMDREPSTQPISKLKFEFERMKLTKDDVRELIYGEGHQSSPSNQDRAPYERMLDNKVEFGSPNKRSSGFFNSALQSDSRGCFNGSILSPKQGLSDNLEKRFQ
ncbi:hypothetical protein JHK82_018746 [Glycine max]|nr:hypothetical protein JHK85_019189 [Glycine max]KAG5143051.1 hypothetical protein JHK82_018746 [Glycine max]